MKFSAFLAICLVLVLLWVGGFVVFHVASLLMHLLLFFAVIFLILHVIRGISRS